MKLKVVSKANYCGYEIKVLLTIKQKKNKKLAKKKKNKSKRNQNTNQHILYNQLKSKYVYIIQQLHIIQTI